MSRLILGDCLEAMAEMEPDSVDAVVTDPPYGLGFMGKKWDVMPPGDEVAAAMLRVLKPAHYLLAFGGTRTHHRLMVALEDAGFEIRDCLMWLYGCLSEDTEVLTVDGWERYHSARTKEILAYDHQADIYQWEKPSRWSEYRVQSDTAYRIESDTTDQIVSRNHRCLVERGGELVFVAAEECADVERVPTLPDDFCAVPQGYKALLFSGVQRPLPGPGVGEARPQRPSSVDGRERGQLPREDEWGEQPGVEGWSDLLQAEGQLRQPVHQVRPMPAGVCDDGQERRLRDGASSARRDGTGATAVALRGCASRQSRRDRQPDRESNPVRVECGSQAVRTRTSYRTTLATITPVEYTGLIFCPTVSTGAFVARRNGKVFLTGNSGFPKGKGQLKPAYEPVILCRKPGGKVRALGIDECRIGTTDDLNGGAYSPTGNRTWSAYKLRGDAGEYQQPSGRWPANIVIDEEAGRAIDEQSGTLPAGKWMRTNGARPFGNYGEPTDAHEWKVDSSKGGASRFFYCAKASRSERNAGCEGLEAKNLAGHNKWTDVDYRKGNGEVTADPQRNHHPTVKPVALMRWLVRLVCPPGGTVLDPFMGSGTTGVAAVQEGREFIGIELDPEYMAIAEARIQHAEKQQLQLAI